VKGNQKIDCGDAFYVLLSEIALHQETLTLAGSGEVI